MPDPRAHEKQAQADTELIVRYIDGQLSEAEFAQLNERMKHDAQLRHRLIDLILQANYVQATASKPDLALVQQELLDMPRDPSLFSDSWQLVRGTRVHPVVWGGIAAVLALAVTLVIVFTGGQDGTPSGPMAIDQPTPGGQADSLPVATLTAVHEAVWGGAGPSALAEGATLHPGQRLTLTQGFAEVTTRRGAVALLEAPAAVEIIGNNTIRLHTGKLVGICETASSKGFLVRTPHMDVTDLGTRFGVDAKAGETSVHVLEGVVAAEVVTSTGVQRDRQTLIAGQAARADGSDRLAGYDADPTRFTQALPARYLPEGTGYGLKHGEVDPNWRVVAIDGKPITQDGTMRVVYPNFGDPASSRWIVVPRDIQPQNENERTITCRASLQLPSSFDPQVSGLTLGFNADFIVAGIRINGQSVDVPENRLDRNAPLTEVAIHPFVRPGDNTIEMDLYDIDLHSALRAAFELKPLSP